MKRYLIAGVLAWLPLAITIWILTQLLGVVDGVFQSMVSAGVSVFRLDPNGAIVGFLRNTPGLSLLAMVAALLLSGVLVTNIAGQWMMRQWDALMHRIPIVKSIYSSVKQVSDTLFSTSGNAFREAVMVQYPRPGAWTIAFVTGKPGGEVVQHLPGDWVSVYVPTTPNPTSGFFLMVPKQDVIELRMSVDQALKYVISMGVVAPPVTLPTTPPAALARTPAVGPVAGETERNRIG